MGSILGVKGRYNRLQWWMTQLAIFAILILTTLLLGLSLSEISEPTEIKPPSVSIALSLLVVCVITFWLNLSASIKRYHDRGKSSWWFLIVMVPLIGPIWQFVELGFLGGDAGNNEYDLDDSFEQSSPYAPRQQQKSAYVEPAPRRAEPAAQRPSYGQKPSFGRRA
jgi:uncharacterized membrane protein YhaH (DUF805 family)